MKDKPGEIKRERVGIMVRRSTRKRSTKAHIYKRRINGVTLQ